MLTGDKIETAKCIAISAGLQGKRQRVFEIVMKEEITDIDIQKRIEELERKINESMLIIDGGVLGMILSKPSLEERFFEVAKNAPSVCICRCSPT